MLCHVAYALKLPSANQNLHQHPTQIKAISLTKDKFLPTIVLFTGAECCLLKKRFHSSLILKSGKLQNSRTYASRRYDANDDCSKSSVKAPYAISLHYIFGNFIGTTHTTWSALDCLLSCFDNCEWKEHSCKTLQRRHILIKLVS